MNYFFPTGNEEVSCVTLFNVFQKADYKQDNLLISNFSFEGLMAETEKSANDVP